MESKDSLEQLHNDSFFFFLFFIIIRIIVLRNFIYFFLRSYFYDHFIYKQLDQLSKNWHVCTKNFSSLNQESLLIDLLSLFYL